VPRRPGRFNPGMMDALERNMSPSKVIARLSPSSRAPSVMRSP